MDEQTLARAIEVLETAPEFYVPVKELWLTLREEGQARGMDLESLQEELAADARFELIEGADDVSGPADEELPVDIERELEALGFSSGPRVRLAAREMKTEDILAGLSRSLERLNRALRGAWDSRPEEDAEAERMLRDALAMAEHLEREIRGIIDLQEDQPPWEDRTP